MTHRTIVMIVMQKGDVSAQLQVERMGRVIQAEE